MLESSFYYTSSSKDDSDDDRDYDKNIEVMSTSKLFYLQYNDYTLIKVTYYNFYFIQWVLFLVHKIMAEMLI